MRSMNKSVPTAVIGLCLLFVLHIAYAQGAIVLLEGVISLKKKVITQHEPVIINLTLQNHSQHAVVVSLGDEDEKLNIEVVDPDGLVFWKPKPTRRGFGATTDAFYIAGGATAVGSVPLDEWFKFEKIGMYQIKVTLASPSSPKEAFLYTIDSGLTTLSLTVLAYDEKSLKSECADLLARVQDLHSPGVALTAAKALSKVNDPVAVPFLAEAMKNKAFTGLMIDALAHLRTKNAVDALIVASQSSDPEMKSLAQSALKSLGVTGNR
jgi:hypothetical protein